jgi:hypothetical protein
MRKAGLGLALIASAQLTLLSSPAFADDSSTKASVTPTESASSASSSGSSSSSTEGTASADKKKTGWIVLGVGAGVTVAGIVLDIVGTQVGSVSGAGGIGDSGTTSNARTNFYWGGTALIVAGLVTGVVGGSMVLNPGGGKSTAPDPASEAHNDGMTKAVQAAYQSAPSFTVPVLGATF